MEINEWWPKLDADAQAWLIAHNGEVVAPDVVSKIVAAGGSLTSSEWWVGETAPDGIHFSDEAVDWVEAKANDESE